MAPPEPLYPPAPPGVPADLARPGLRYRLLVALLLLALALFLLAYLALMAASLYLMLWAVAPPAGVSARASAGTGPAAFFALLRVGLFAASAMFFAFLLKGLFKRQQDDTLHYLEVTEQNQPQLHAFIRSLCREVGSPPPAAVYLSHEVNAAVFSPTSLLNLLAAPPKHLLIGLGLLHDITLVEFKALLAHEFGHFSQRSLRLSGYALLAYRAVHDMVVVRDRWDDWVVRGFDTPWLSAFAVPLAVLVGGTRKLLVGLFRLLDGAHRALRRQMEFNADLVAVGVAGSDAPVGLLVKSEFSQACLRRAAQDLALAAEHGRFSRDLFYHLGRAAEALRAAQDDPGLGRPPAPGPEPALAPGEDAGPAAMWAEHPTHPERERNAKRRYFPSPADDRPAWLVFRDADSVREEVTRGFYRASLHVEPPGPLADPEAVQAFLDEERAALTFDPCYRGVYDDRLLELPDLDELAREAGESPPAPDQLACPPGDLYSDELWAWLEDHRRRLGEFDLLSAVCSGRQEPGGDQFVFRGRHYPASEAAGLLARVQSELEEDRAYLGRFDRSVFALHDFLARQLGEGDELRRRYGFHLGLEQLLRLAWQQQGRVESVLHFLSSRRVLSWEEVSRLKEALAQARDGVAEVYRRAGGLSPPPLRHVAAGEPLDRLLPPRPQAPDLTSAETALDAGRLAAFHGQLAAVLDRLGRLRAKSLGALLALQDGLAREWGRGAGTGTPAPESAGGDERTETGGGECSST
jgi:Zn-dependent protease with chaperone function